MNVNWEGILPFQGEILVIEDDPTLRALMVEIVEEMGARVSAFDSADDAITYLLQANDQCCLTIVDHHLPGQIQGIEFIEMVASRVAEHQDNSHVGLFDRSRSGARTRHIPAQTMVAG